MDGQNFSLKVPFDLEYSIMEAGNIRIMIGTRTPVSMDGCVEMIKIVTGSISTSDATIEISTSIIYRYMPANQFIYISMPFIVIQFIITRKRSQSKHPF